MKATSRFVPKARSPLWVDGPSASTSTDLMVFASVPSYVLQMCSGMIGTHGGTVGAKVGFLLVQISVVASGVSKVESAGR